MLISEFARETGLSVDTVRFYVRKGLLTPEIGRKGGSNPYQLFSEKDAHNARVIRLAQSLGLSLKEIAAFNEEYVAGRMTARRTRDIMQTQLARLNEKAGELAHMIDYVKAKIAWLDGGSKGPEPALSGAVCAAAALSDTKATKPRPLQASSRAS